MQKALTYFALVMIFLIGGLLGFWIRGLCHEPVEPNIQYDTVWTHDTTTIIRPEPHYIRVVDTMLIAVPVVDTIHVRDSVYISLPREEKVYADSSYRAVVSGYMPSLDSISVYPSTAIVHVPVTRYVTKRWGIGVQAGVGVQYGTIRKQMDIGPYIGVGISYNLLNF